MTIGINNVLVAGNVPVHRPASEVQARPQIDSPAVPKEKGADAAFRGGAAPSLGQSQALVAMESQHRVADAVRHAQAAIGQISDLLGRMEDGLQAIVKQYPPYPAESRERMELLNSIAGLRKQIDALTFPPPDREQPTLVGDPLQTANAGDVQFALGGQQHVLHAQPAHSGAEGLNLPLLGDQASDEEVARALGQVQDAHGRLAVKHATLTQELEAMLLPRNEQVEAVIRASRDELADQVLAISRTADNLNAYWK